MSRVPIVFATDKEGRGYIKVKAIMHPLVAMCDGLTIITFGKETTMYLKIDDAIEWCKKEAKYHSKERYEAIIAGMERFKVQENLAKAE